MDKETDTESSRMCPKSHRTPAQDGSPHSAPKAQLALRNMEKGLRREEKWDSDHSQILPTLASLPSPTPHPPWTEDESGSLNALLALYTLFSTWSSWPPSHIHHRASLSPELIRALHRLPPREPGLSAPGVWTLLDSGSWVTGAGGPP